MGFLSHCVQFFVGGGGYVLLELLWRGRSHGSMFFAGGLCFLLLGRIGRLRLPLLLRGVLGAAAVTAVELAVGLLVNRQHTVWDYRSLPLNFCGQICLTYSLLWVPVSLLAMALHRPFHSRAC